MSTTLTPQQRAVIVQALTGGTDQVYRNWYAAGPTHHSANAIQQLLAMGYLRAGRLIGQPEGARYYHVTASGAAAMMLHLPHCSEATA